MLNRMAIRICAVHALAGNSFAGENVKDSVIAAIDPESHPDEDQPFIAVYTDEQSKSSLVLSLEIGVTARMSQTNEAGEDIIVAGIPPTDAGIEMLLDAIERQIHTALADEGNEWAELLGTCFVLEDEVKSVRGASKNNSGERYAGRQILFTGKPLNDPEFGRSLNQNGFWFKFLAKVDTEPSLTEIAGLIRVLLGADSGVDDWVLAVRALGLSKSAANSLGIAPVVGDEMTNIAGSEIISDVTVVGT